MNHQYWVELVEIYATGCLDGKDLSQCEEHLSLCPPCVDHLVEIQEILLILPKALHVIVPSAEIKKCLLEKISKELS